MYRSLLAVAATLLALMFVAPAHAVTLAFDTFDVGAATVNDDPGDPNDIAWSDAGGSNISVENRNIFAGGANAFKNQGGASFRGHLGAIPSGPVGLNAVGDQLTLSFDFETNNASGLGDLNGGSGDVEGYRFGFFAGDGSGYFVNIGVGGVGAFTIEKDTNTGNSRAASSGNTVLASLGGGPSITDEMGHTFDIVMTRTVSGVEISADYDSGTAFLSVEDTSSPITSFDDIYGGTGDHPIDFWVDNVQVVSAPVPEPSSIALTLLAVGGCGLALAIRRRD